MRRKPILAVVLSVALASCSEDGEVADGSEVAEEPSEVADDVTEETEDVEESEEVRPAGEAAPIESTGADAERDLIRAGDAGAAYCLADMGVGPGEFYNKGTDQLLFPDETYYVEARFDDGVTIEIRIHPDIVSGNHMEQADRIAAPISLLPTELRQSIERVGFLGGESTAQADGGGEGIHVYGDNVAVRENANRFEETIFHESVHTSFDDTYGSDPDWLAAQSADGAFLTEYAAGNPSTEDLAETSLYAWALLHHPERISEADAAAWRALVPARIAFVEGILSAPGTGYEPATPSC